MTLRYPRSRAERPVLLREQRRKASSEDDAAQLSPVPVERGPAVVDCDCIQSGESLETACSATEDRELILGEPATAASENGWTAGETCPLLLAIAGGESSDAAAVRSNAGADRGAAAAVGIAETMAPKKTISISVRSTSPAIFLRTFSLW